MHIRQAVLTDLESILKINVFGGNRALEISKNEMWVLEIAGEIAGFITFNYSFFERPFIKYLNVDKKFRRQHVAQQLVRFIEQKCAGQKLFTSTEATNLPMILFFNKNNYVLAGMINEIQDVAEIVYCKQISIE